jgi:hypothetical protein
MSGEAKGEVRTAEGGEGQEEGGEGDKKGKRTGASATAAG